MTKFSNLICHFRQSFLDICSAMQETPPFFVVCFPKHVFNSPLRAKGTFKGGGLHRMQLSLNKADKIPGSCDLIICI